MYKFSWLFNNPYVLLAELFFSPETSEFRKREGIYLSLNGNFENLQIVSYS